jgi:hypothetical protein
MNEGKSKRAFFIENLTLNSRAARLAIFSRLRAPSSALAFVLELPVSSVNR